MISRKKKSWQEKLADKEGWPKVLKLEKRFPCYNAVHSMGAGVGDDVVLANPSEVTDIMRRIPKGKLITIVEICKAIAKKHQVKGCCSLTTGIFIMIAAYAVKEAASQGKKLGIPYWRTLKAQGLLNEKYPGGTQAQQELLEKEGFKVVRKGRKAYVENYTEHLAFPS